jgi:hypothetical protein
MEDKIDLRWRKSSYSGNGGGNCVEVAVDGRVMVRDSRDRAGTVLRFPSAAWRKFADQVKRSLALDPRLARIPPLYRSARFPAYWPGAHPCALRLCPLCSANGRGVWGGRDGASGRPRTGRGFPRGSGIPPSAFPDLTSSSWRRC